MLLCKAGLSNAVVILEQKRSDGYPLKLRVITKWFLKSSIQYRCVGKHKKKKGASVFTKL
jgi:hypothetical protein